MSTPMQFFNHVRATIKIPDGEHAYGPENKAMFHSHPNCNLEDMSNAERTRLIECIAVVKTVKRWSEPLAGYAGQVVVSGDENENIIMEADYSELLFSVVDATHDAISKNQLGPRDEAMGEQKSPAF